MRSSSHSLGPAVPAALRESLEICRFESPSEIEQEWRQLETSGIGTIFQRFDWVDAYARHVLPHERARPAIVLGRLDGQPAFILPLAISKTGPARVARWIGGKHAGYNFGLWSVDGAAAVAGLGRAGIGAALRTVLKEADCAILDRMPLSHDSLPQPFASWTHSRSSTEGYSADLTGGFEAVLAKNDAKKRRRKIQSKERKMREFGPLCFCVLDAPEDAHAALEFFYQHKAVRLAEQGWPNSFAEPGVAGFFRELLDRSQELPDPLLEMTELSVDGKPRAVIGSGIHHGRTNVYFMTFTKDELSPQSPGSVLTFRHIEDSCKRGLDVYDLGVGYEPYKAQWCDVIHTLNDAYAAFTPLGAALIASVRLAEATKHQFRKNASLWRGLRSARAYLSRRSIL